MQFQTGYYEVIEPDKLRYAEEEYARLVKLFPAHQDEQPQPSFFRMHFDAFWDLTACSFFTRVPPPEYRRGEIIYRIRWSTTTGVEGDSELYQDFSRSLKEEGLSRSGYEQFMAYGGVYKMFSRLGYNGRRD